ncbi:MAG: hypothetical protein ABEJ58_08300 [Halodesulfurarchaeum sp.]
MVLFELLHVLGGVLGLLAAVGLVGPWTEWAWHFRNASWAAVLAVVASGIVLSLSTVGTGATLASGLLLGKVVLTLLLIVLMYSTLVGSDAENLSESTSRMLAILALWVVIFGMGIGTVL